MSRIVVKIGSNVLTRDDGTLDVTRMSSLVDQVAMLHRRGEQVIMVTSGAVACGKWTLRSEHHLDKVEQRQLFSAVGQVVLMNHYSILFSEWGIDVGQVLTTRENFSSPMAYSNQKQCMEVMLENSVIPIVNENDTVCVTELMFTDNDELSGLVSRMMSADVLILLSNIDGLYDGYPGEDDAKLIPVVKSDEDIDGFISDRKSSAGRGGMGSKCHTAASVAAAGIKVMIANGRRDNVILDLFDADKSVPHTEFIK